MFKPRLKQLAQISVPQSLAATPVTGQVILRTVDFFPIMSSQSHMRTSTLGFQPRSARIQMRHVRVNLRLTSRKIQCVQVTMAKLTPLRMEHSSKLRARFTQLQLTIPQPSSSDQLLLRLSESVWRSAPKSPRVWVLTMSIVLEVIVWKAVICTNPGVELRLPLHVATVLPSQNLCY